jgi:hypothetical protein
VAAEKRKSSKIFWSKSPLFVGGGNRTKYYWSKCSKMLGSNISRALIPASQRFIDAYKANKSLKLKNIRAL